MPLGVSIQGGDTKVIDTALSQVTASARGQAYAALTKALSQDSAGQDAEVKYQMARWYAADADARWQGE